MRIITVKMPEELVEKIDTLARINNMTRSELIRLAVSMLVNGDEALTLLYPREWVQDNYEEEVVVIQ